MASPNLTTCWIIKYGLHPHETYAAEVLRPGSVTPVPSLTTYPDAHWQNFVIPLSTHHLMPSKSSAPQSRGTFDIHRKPVLAPIKPSWGGEVVVHDVLWNHQSHCLCDTDDISKSLYSMLWSQLPAKGAFTCGLGLAAQNLTTHLPLRCPPHAITAKCGYISTTGIT
mmetsp:Transcript_55488/g.98845  ORF Transcript_55488/g.98845 Transcript_55488/m.98845 type:complete len:167 (+) Transcript_55488:725-1225(+)